MAGFDENIVREYFEYFELHGFLVRQLRKYLVQSRPKMAEEEIDLMVYNPAFSVGGRKPGFLLFSSEPGNLTGFCGMDRSFWELYTEVTKQAATSHWNHTKPPIRSWS